MNQIKLTTEQKWAEVDAIIRNIKRRITNGDTGCHTALDEYIDTEFIKRLDDNNVVTN